jgi:micrococcal nuclease
VGWCLRTVRPPRAFAVALALALALTACIDEGSKSTVAPADASLPAGDDAVVGKIVDGDTLRTTDDVRVRLLNIDTPELQGDECWSSEATDALDDLVPRGTEIRLVYDEERLDRFGRTLAHVYRRRDGLWVNLELVEEGAAHAYVLQPNDARYEPIKAAAGDARAAGVGLWGACPR